MTKYSDFSGRASRKEFWRFFAVSGVALVAVVILTGISAEPTAEASPVWAVVYLLWWLGTALPWFSTQVRRLHDQGRSGWLVAFNLAGYAALFIQPVASLILFAVSLIIMALPGEAGANRFGAPAGEPMSEDGVEGAAAAPAASLPRQADRAEGPHSHGRAASGGPGFDSYRKADRVAAVQRSLARRPQFGRSEAARVLIAERPAASRKAVAREPASVSTHPASSSSGEYEVKRTADGRYSSGGYAFATEAQAENFAARRRGLHRQPAPARLLSHSSPHSSRASSIKQAEPVTSPSPLAQAVSNTQGETDAVWDRLSRSLRGGPGPSSPQAGAKTVADERISPTPPPLHSQAPMRWVADKTPLAVSGVSFEAELLYFGSNLGAGRVQTQRSLVDPTLPVSSQADSLGTTLDYWPNYSDLAPSGRRAFLEWLAGGRSDPSTPIGYVFIYFYGLERRLIAEKSERDAPAILAEARRLLSIYGENYSFRNYCSALIEAGELIFGLAQKDEPVTLGMRRGWEIPIGVRIRLGRKIRDGAPIDADDALRWVLTHPQLYPRTAVARCFEEFCALWQHRYAEAFPGGIKVRGGKARLQFSYRAASSEFNAQAPVEDLPDVGAIAGPVSKLDALLGQCTDELDPLSRYLGRNPEDRNSLLAAALCPALALSADAARSVAAARAGLLSSADSDGLAAASLRKVLDILAGADTAVSADQRGALLKRMPAILDAIEVGFEPDRRHGPAPALADDIMLFLFELEGGGGTGEGRDEVRPARTMVEIAVLAAKADDLVVEAEIASIMADLEQLSGLDASDRRRLHAHARALAANPSKLRAATKRLIELSDAEKERVLATAVHAILADQRVLPSEVRFLEGLYKALGRPQDEVYARLHAGDAGRAAGRAPVQPTGGKIDAERLARLRQETTAVSSMLSQIFREEEAVPGEPAPSVRADERCIPGLDAAHTHVLLALVEQPIESDAFQTLCRAHRLLPDGAIETINDWGFDALDDVAIESEDLISIQPHLIASIRSMAIA